MQAAVAPAAVAAAAAAAAVVTGAVVVAEVEAAAAMLLRAPTAVVLLSPARVLEPVVAMLLPALAVAVSRSVAVIEAWPEDYGLPWAAAAVLVAEAAAANAGMHAVAGAAAAVAASEGAFSVKTIAALTPGVVSRMHLLQFQPGLALGCCKRR